MSDVYGRLRERRDDFASGYPATESRIEIKMLFLLSLHIQGKGIR